MIRFRLFEIILLYLIQSNESTSTDDSLQATTRAAGMIVHFYTHYFRLKTDFSGPSSRYPLYYPLAVANSQQYLSSGVGYFMQQVRAGHQQSARGPQLVAHGDLLVGRAPAVLLHCAPRVELPVRIWHGF